jgi:hypothetical protein
MRNCWPHPRPDTNSLDAALLLVHSFSEELVGWSDYQGITRLVGSPVPLFGLWVVGNCSYLRS